jgi:hypothetical protein
MTLIRVVGSVMWPWGSVKVLDRLTLVRDYGTNGFHLGRQKERFDRHLIAIV